ncbi:hypothetical protein [Vibrio vulnificus YJ016]|uniref:Uncharacterized protein n=1 Tax=Vibrio vulnificus (strain YJ016) TaxID=196600 RepID=Q7MN90_VIBVY|nr:hypothetical protein VVMO6_02390 [Vibrio vulnificus MO6-24/O]BAC93591.1 hypothetical protein [Vibrio vulnificus YJ016]
MRKHTFSAKQKRSLAASLFLYFEMMPPLLLIEYIKRQASMLVFLFYGPYPSE